MSPALSNCARMRVKLIAMPPSPPVGEHREFGVHTVVLYVPAYVEVVKGTPSRTTEGSGCRREPPVHARRYANSEWWLV